MPVRLRERILIVERRNGDHRSDTDGIDLVLEEVRDAEVNQANAAGVCSLRTLLAARDGAIAGFVEIRADQPIPLWRLLVERTSCVNTTAAGGNASLMTLQG